MATFGLEVFGKDPIRSGYRRRIGQAFDKAVARVVDSFEQHEQGYSGGFDGGIHVDRRRTDVIDVYVEDTRLFYVNEGTKPHTISARNGGSLAFSSSFVAATTPNTIPAQAAQYSGNVVHRQSVQHPGITPREIDKAIADDVRPLLKKLVKGVIRG